MDVQRRQHLQAEEDEYTGGDSAHQVAISMPGISHGVRDKHQTSMSSQMPTTRTGLGHMHWVQSHPIRKTGVPMQWMMWLCAIQAAAIECMHNRHPFQGVVSDSNEYWCMPLLCDVCCAKVRAPPDCGSHGELYGRYSPYMGKRKEQHRMGEGTHQKLEHQSGLHSAVFLTALSRVFTRSPSPNGHEHSTMLT
jgi:hypothetical protein